MEPIPTVMNWAGQARGLSGQVKFQVSLPIGQASEKVSFSPARATVTTFLKMSTNHWIQRKDNGSYIIVVFAFEAATLKADPHGFEWN